MLAVAALALQGCGGKGHRFGKRSAQEGQPRASNSEPEDLQIGSQKVLEGHETLEEEEPQPVIEQKNIPCDSLVNSKSEEFRKAARQDAQAYYDGVVKTFSLDFVKYPFCLENNYFVVHALERKMRGLDKFKQMPSASFEVQLNDTITNMFKTNEDKWQTMCQDWAERNKAHQLSNLNMVRKVLAFDGDDEDLKAQIRAFFGWHPWWKFFQDVAKSGCVRRYTQQCERSAKVANRHAKELVMQTTGDRDMTWHAFDIPSDSLIQTHEEFRHQVPIELKAGGQQLRSRRASSVK